MRFYVIKERGKSAALYLFRESSFNMTRGGGGVKKLRELRKFLDTLKGDSEKIMGVPKICILQNQQERGGS